MRVLRPRRRRGERRRDDPVPAEDRQAVRLQVADHPLDGHHRGEEGEDQADERVDDAELVDQRTAWQIAGKKGNKEIKAYPAKG